MNKPTTIKQQILERKNWLANASVTSIMEKFDVTYQRAAILKFRARKFLGQVHKPKISRERLVEIAPDIIAPGVTIDDVATMLGVSYGYASSLRGRARILLEIPTIRKRRTKEEMIADNAVRRKQSIKTNKPVKPEVEIIDLRELRRLKNVDK